MLRFHRRLRSTIASLALIAVTAPAAINDMHMFSGGGGGLGGSSPCLSPEELIELAKAINATAVVSAKRAMTFTADFRRRANEHPACVEADRIQQEITEILSFYRALLPKDAIEHPERAHRMVLNDALALDLGSRSPHIIQLINDAQGYWQDCELLPASGDPFALLRERDGETAESRALGTTAASESIDVRQALVVLQGLGKIPTGPTLRSPYEPYLAARGTFGATLNANYWQFNRYAEEKLDGDHDLASMRLDLVLDYALTNWFTIVGRAGLLTRADDPEGMRGAGFTDPEVGFKLWWTQPSTTSGDTKLGSLSERLHLGSGFRLALPFGDEEYDRGHGRTVAHIDWFKASYQAQTRHVPRLHLTASRILELHGEGDPSPSRYPGGNEVVFGFMWNDDAWRVGVRKNFNWGFWGDVVGMFHDRPMGSPGFESARALELRGGLAFLWQRGGLDIGDRAVRHIISLEGARRLDDEGLRSAFSVHAVYRLQLSPKLRPPRP